MRYLKFVILALILSGCFATTYQMKNTFKVEDAYWIKEKGNATITGQAFLNQKSGAVVTCAGKEVVLTPVNSYSSERMQAIYGSTGEGYKDDIGMSIISLEPKPPADYYSLSKTARCDAQGNFKFKEVLGNKEYFITTSVLWGIDWLDKEGGYLMLRVNPKPKETLEVILN